MFPALAALAARFAAMAIGGARGAIANVGRGALRGMGRRARSRRRARMHASHGGSPLNVRARAALRRRPRTKSGRAAHGRLRASLDRYTRAMKLRASLPPGASTTHADKRVKQSRARLSREFSRYSSRVPDASVTKPFTEFLKNAATGLAGFAVSTYSAARAMEAVGRQYGQYNSQFASANAQLDVSRIQRTMRIGAATGDSYSRMIQSLNKLEEATVPFQIFIMNATSTILEWATGVLEWMAGVGDAILQYLPFLKKSHKADDVSMADQLNKLDVLGTSLNNLAFKMGPMMNQLGKPQPNVPNRPAKGKGP